MTNQVNIIIWKINPLNPDVRKSHKNICFQPLRALAQEPARLHERSWAWEKFSRYLHRPPTVIQLFAGPFAELPLE